jgi:UrcA family protein
MLEPYGMVFRPIPDWKTHKARKQTMIKHPFALLLAGVIGVGGLLVGSPVAARDQDRGVETLAIRVTSSGLDLGRTRGAGAMLGRIREAARETCAFQYAYPSDGCIRAKVDAAVARLGNPMVAVANHGGR